MSEFCLAPVKREGTTVCRYCYCEIRKPLTLDAIDALCDVHLWSQEESRESSGIYKLIREVEKAHGIGEKE